MGLLITARAEAGEHLRLQELQGGLEGLQESEVNASQNIGAQILANRR